MQPRDFLQELYGDELSSSQLLNIFTLQRGEDRDFKKSYWLPELDSLDELLANNAHADVYFGIGLSPKNYGPNNRCKAKDVCVVPGLWADVDYAHELHQKNNLPPTKADAVSLIASSLPPHIQPTLAVHTGHGFHFYWLFKEPFVIETDQERVEIEDLSRRWQYTLKYYAACRGWELDSTFDLSRVFRLPGSLNRKGTPVPVTCEQVDGDRYNPEDFKQVLVDIDPARDGEIAGLLSEDKNPLKIVVSAEAEPPLSKFDALRKFSSLFRKTFDGERADKTGDTSLSSGDLSLANICVEYDWSPQEIANLLIYFRRKHAQTERKFAKALRVDYLNRTILLAMKDRDRVEADEALDDASVQLARHRDDPGTVRPPEVHSLKANLQKVLNVKIHRIWKFLGDDPKYEIELESGQKIMLGSVTNLIQQGNLRNLLAAHCGVLLPRFKADVWDKYATLLLQSCDEVRTGEETSVRDMLASYVRQYLNASHFASDWRVAVHDGAPYVKDGRTYVFGSSLRSWMRICAEPMTAKEMGVTFSSMGIKAKTQGFTTVNDDGSKSRTSASVYDVTRIVGAYQGKKQSLAKNVVSFPKSETSAQTKDKSNDTDAPAEGPFAGASD